MLTIEKTDVCGFEAAIRGMRNPMNSWDKSDSFHAESYDDNDSIFIIGENDLTLMKKLVSAGSDHRKFMRFITVTFDITAPLYWWKEYDTYKVGTVANSCSTMHKIHSKEFTIDDFSIEHLIPEARSLMWDVIDMLNDFRDGYINYEEWRKEGRLRKDTPDKKTIWDNMIQLLPTSYNQKRTVLLNYEVLLNMYDARKNHKLDEWYTMCDWILTLPYFKEITGRS